MDEAVARVVQRQPASPPPPPRATPATLRPSIAERRQKRSGGEERDEERDKVVRGGVGVSGRWRSERVGGMVRVAERPERVGEGGSVESRRDRSVWVAEA